MLRRLLLIAAATATIAVTTHAGLLWLLLWAATVAAVTIKTTSKTQSNEARIGRLVSGVSQAATTVNTRVSNLSGQDTSAVISSGSGYDTGTGLPGGVPTGGPNSGSFSGHTHDFDGHTHDFSHVHQLPFV